MTSNIKPFNAPPWICAPKLINCGLKVKKDNKYIMTIDLIQKRKYVLFGRNAQMSDIKLEHPSISRRHALIGHGSSGNIYLMDLGSSHGTYINGNKLQKKRREPLKNNDLIKFGASTRQYIIKFDLDYNKNDSDNDIDNNDNNNDKKRKLNGDKIQPNKKQKIEDINDNNNNNNVVHCLHLLIKHKDSRKPKSWKSDKIERTKDDAIEILKKYRNELIVNKNDTKLLIENFKKLANKESDCKSFKRGGNLGKFGKGKMHKAFEDVAFNLNIGQLSNIVDTKSGVHLILRIA